MSKQFFADTGEHKDLQHGDTVIITECRPLSKNKRFRVTEVVQRVPRVSEMKEEAETEKTIHREKEAPKIKEEKVQKEAKEEKETEKSDSPAKE